MFKKRERPAALRKRDDDGDGESGAVPAGAESKRAKVAANANTTSGVIGATTRKGDSAAATSIEERGSDTALSGFKASDTVTIAPRDDAVRLLETETEFDKDTRARHERNEKIHQGLKDGTLEAGVYRGLEGYKRYAERSEGAISKSKYSGLLGPTRGMSNVRSTMRIEYWNASSGTDGGICKDYKETGYCGFGDSCKFLHDRSDYKQGYELEKEWEAKQKAIEDKKRKQWEKRMQKKAEAGTDASSSSEGVSDDSDEEELPTACPGCNSKWEECSSIPVQTVCGHYFCEDCAMGNYAKTPKCMACGAPTNGIFNSCEALEEKIKQRKAQKLARKKASANNGVDPFNHSLET